MSSGSAMLNNCTISGNSAGSNGGGKSNSYGGSATLGLWRGAAD
jgi:hypothetical protein